VAVWLGLTEAGVKMCENTESNEQRTTTRQGMMMMMMMMRVRYEEILEMSFSRQTPLLDVIRHLHSTWR
jgi:hypothetical protein